MFPAVENMLNITQEAATGEKIHLLSVTEVCFPNQEAAPSGSWKKICNIKVAV